MKDVKKRNKKLWFAGVSIIIGLMLMRLAWIIINQVWGTIIITTGSILFLGGVVFFANTLFNRKD